MSMKLPLCCNRLTMDTMLCCGRIRMCASRALKIPATVEEKVGLQALPRTSTGCSPVCGLNGRTGRLSRSKRG